MLARKRPKSLNDFALGVGLVPVLWVALENLSEFLFVVFYEFIEFIDDPNQFALVFFRCKLVSMKRLHVETELT